MLNENEIEIENEKNYDRVRQDSALVLTVVNETNAEQPQSGVSQEFMLTEMNTNPQNDAFHIEMDESQWLPCVPKLSLTTATIIGAIIGIAIGLAISLTDTILSDDWQTLIALPGDLWIRALKLLVLPLICLMMITLPSRVSTIGIMGKYCIPLYLFTSLVGAIQGSIWGWLVRPGDFGKVISSNEEVTEERMTEIDAFVYALKSAIPENIFEAMVELNILGAITFFLTIGILLRRLTPEQRNSVLVISNAILRCCMIAVVWVIWLAPIGMFSLVTAKVASTENLTSLVKGLGLYLFTVIIGQLVHLLVFYPILMYATIRFNAYTYMLKIYQVPLLAFATSSSAATLPRSLQVAEKNGISPDVYQFVLPLGATINMDGTALGFPVMIAFISQLNSVPQNFGTVALIAVLSVVVSVGAAPIPNVGMVYLLMLLQAANLSKYQSDAIATLFVLDWLVDRLETAMNVTSDQFICKIVEVYKTKHVKKDSGVEI